MAKQASRQSTKNYCLFAVITVSLAIAASLFTFELFLRFFPLAWLKYRMDFISRNQSDVGFGTDAAWKAQNRNGEFWRFKPNSEFNVFFDEFNHIAHIDELGGRSVAHRGDKSAARMLNFPSSMALATRCLSITFLFSASRMYRLAVVWGMVGRLCPSHRCHSPFLARASLAEFSNSPASMA